MNFQKWDKKFYQVLISVFFKFEKFACSKQKKGSLKILPLIYFPTKYSEKYEKIKIHVDGPQLSPQTFI